MPSADEHPPRPIPDSLIPSNPSDLSDKLPKLIPRRGAKGRPSKSAPPPTPALPRLPSPQELTFAHPTRRILSPHDHELFLKSSTHKLIVAFIFNIADSVRDTPISVVTSQEPHPTIVSLLKILDAASEIQEQSPPDNTNGSRFGNPAFRTFLSSLASSIDTLHRNELRIEDSGALDELRTYFLASFGSPLRIDYGSGHELNFFMYLLCLHQQSFFIPTQTAFPQIALVLFPRYLRLMRAVQEAYYLEPAGSHGVWGLDDYHFLPFLFGASQLASHPFIRPLGIHSEPTLDDYADDFLYLDMVRYVNATKTVQGLRWHSPMLDDISGVREGWGKIETGMRKMFLNEVLGKLVVMQHFLFGGLIPANEGMNGDTATTVEVADGESQLRQELREEEELAEGHEGHVHNPSSWGDCCGIRVPSSVGAAQEMRKRLGGDGLRRIPFD